MDKPKSFKEPSPEIRKRGSTGDIGTRLEEITLMEEQLIALKQKYVETVSHASEDSLSEDESTFLIISNMGDGFALPITFVEEVVQMTAVKSLPDEVRGVVGLLNYHGEILAVIDFGELLTGKKSAVTTAPVLVVCRIDTRRFALMVEEAVDVVAVHRSEIRISDAVLPGVLRGVGVLRVAEATVIIVDAFSIALAVQLDRIEERFSEAPTVSFDGPEDGA